jgi:transcriptional regulator with XRE-family HTH domain
MYTVKPFLQIIATTPTNDASNEGMTIGDRLKKARTKKGWSQRQLDFHSGVDFTTISKIERGERDPQASTIIRLCTALAISADDLLGLRVTEMRASPATETELLDCLERYPGMDEHGANTTLAVAQEIAKRHGESPKAATG